MARVADDFPEILRAARPRKDADAVSPWDLVPERVGRHWTGSVGGGQQHPRMIARTEGIDRLCQRMAAGPPESDEPAFLALGADLSARRRAWRSILGLGPPPSARPVEPVSQQTDGGEDSPVLDSLRHAPGNIATGFLFGGGAVVVLLILAGALWVALGVAAIGGAALASRPGLRRRLARALDDDRCPKCSYDLRGIGPPLGLEAKLDVRVGPARCPECGCAWPLVPATVIWRIPSE